MQPNLRFPKFLPVQMPEIPQPHRQHSVIRRSVRRRCHQLLRTLAASELSPIFAIHNIPAASRRHNCAIRNPSFTRPKFEIGNEVAIPRKTDISANVKSATAACGPSGHNLDAGNRNRPPAREATGPPATIFSNFSRSPVIVPPGMLAATPPTSPRYD